MKVPAELWPQISRLFDELLDQQSSSRAAWLARLEIDLPIEAGHLRRLLASHECPVGEDILSASPAEAIAAALAGDAGLETLQPGDTFGPYRLIAPIGRGGMATVWLADQTVNVTRRVALKIPLRGIEDPATMTARFELERDFLAALEHPHIARLYDAGVTALGQPYLVMEWVDGEPITAYADAHRLTIDERIGLFLQVLSAVRHAHTRLVIHRDLKPSNILVTASGEVKLLDFGIARLLGARLATDRAGAVATRTAMTPECASPEQLAGDTLGTPSDVYSLGVVLYELLVGHRPYRLNANGLNPGTSALHARLMALSYPWPSAVPVTPAAAAARSTTVHRLRRGLAGDLDAIVAKGLAKEASLRYESADEFNADLRRWQDLRPVLARPATSWYRTERFLRRNRSGVVAGTAVVLALSAGLGVSLWQAERARQEARLAGSVQSLLTRLFAASDPEQARGKDLGAKELLSRGAERLDAELKDQPAVSARLHRVIGTIYFQLGDNVAAIDHLQRALRLFDQTGQPTGEEAIDAQCWLAEALSDENQFDPAREAAGRCMDLAEQRSGPNNRWRLRALKVLAWMDIQTGHAAPAADRLEKAIAEAEQLRPRPAFEIDRAKSDLGSAYLDLGQPQKARDLFAEQIRMAPSIPGVELTDRLVDRLNWARACYLMDDFEPASQELAALVPAMEQQIGPGHDRTIKARTLWVLALAELGEFDQAVRIQQDNLETVQHRPSVDPELLSVQQLALAKALKLAARPAQALPLAAKGVAFLDAKYPEPTWIRETGRRILGESLLQTGRIDEAVAVLHQATTNVARLAGHASNVKYADFLQSEALAVWRRGRPQDVQAALGLLDQAGPIYAGAQMPKSRSALRYAVHRSWLDALTHPRDPAATAAFARAGQEFADILPPHHVGRVEVLLMQAELSQREGNAALARQQLDAGKAAWMATMHAAFRPPFLALH